jgi:hypothetical protein
MRRSSDNKDDVRQGSVTKSSSPSLNGSPHGARSAVKGDRCSGPKSMFNERSDSVDGVDFESVPRKISKVTEGDDEDAATIETVVIALQSPRSPAVQRLASDSPASLANYAVNYPDAQDGIPVRPGSGFAVPNPSSAGMPAHAAPADDAGLEVEEGRGSRTTIGEPNVPVTTPSTVRRLRSMG